MNRRTACWAAFLSIAIFAMSGCSSQDAAASKGEKPSYFTDQRRTATAKLEAINPASRMITLREDDGSRGTFKVDREVRNLDQVKVGDTVKVDYYESILIKVLDPGEPVNEYNTSVDRSEPGDRPGGAATQSLTMTGRVEEVNKDSSRVTVRGPAGNLRAITVRDKKKLDNIHVGDGVQLTYTESLAVAVIEQGQPASAPPTP